MANPTVPSNGVDSTQFLLYTRSTFCDFWRLPSQRILQIRVAHSYGPTPEQRRDFCFALVWDLNWGGQSWQRAGILSLPPVTMYRWPVNFLVYQTLSSTLLEPGVHYQTIGQMDLQDVVNGSKIL